MPNQVDVPPTSPRPLLRQSGAVAQPASSRLFNTNAVREYDSDDHDVDVDRRPDRRVFSPFAESPRGAREEVLQLASKLGINISIVLAYLSSIFEIGVENQLKYAFGDVSVYLVAAPIVEFLEMYTPDVIMTSRVADASLFLAPMDGTGTSCISWHLTFWNVVVNSQGVITCIQGCFPLDSKYWRQNCASVR
ncbi:hypothetical protein PHJA_000361500 [Phtheirospermum japonicum]|uniref:Uncharacterized protein n=1 Tax=Phtheirospermum japonicum TaxID=374723 RepID=A0A830B8H4_9LAMI|nr:hypothetical protein PHJA_000361500 [Phtheirospermum japonicum]